MEIVIGIVVVLIIVVAIAVVVAGRRNPQAGDPLMARMAEYSARETPVTLEELEMSQSFNERVITPMLRQLGEFVLRFTPEASLKAIQHQLDLAGNPKGMEPVTFYATRIVMSVAAVGVVILLASIAQDQTMFFAWGPNFSNAPTVLGLAAGGAALGYYVPNSMLNSRIRRRQDSIIKSMPDALDLLTVCVEAGLGFDQAMQKVSEKWENELSLAFARVIQEIRLGKPRREALRDMADRMDIPDMTSFVAALIQADQLGVSMAKVLRIQSDQMRMRRRQRAEKKAHEAPILMLIPMAFMIFPAIYIVLLGPAVFQVLRSGVLGSLGG